MLTVPFIVAALTPNGLADEWYHVFVLHATILFITNALFCKLGKGTPAAFTHSSKASVRAPDGALSDVQMEPVFL